MLKTMHPRLVELDEYHVNTRIKLCWCATFVASNVLTTSLQVVTGSLQGQVRIHCPVHQDQEARDALVLEVNLGLPILQLACGRFVPHDTSQLALAVLHPRRLLVYTVHPAAASSKDIDLNSRSVRSGGPLELELLHSYALNSAASFSAANMCCGPFGGVSSDGGDGLCVQSMDGQVRSVIDLPHFEYIKYLNLLIDFSTHDVQSCCCSKLSLM